MKRIIFAVVIVLILGGLIYVTVVGTGTQERASGAGAIPAGHEQPIPGALYVNGYNLMDIGDSCPIATWYRSFSGLSGVPVSSFNGITQLYSTLRIRCLPERPVGERIIIDSLGLEHLRLSGKAAIPDSVPHPAVMQHILQSYRLGLPPEQLFGRLIEPVHTEPGSKDICTQLSDTIRFRFACDATSADQVAWAPLGIESLPVVAVVPPHHFWTMWRIVSVVGMVGLFVLGAVLVRRLRHEQRGFAT